MNEQIVAAMNAWSEPARLWIAAHEIGHALALLAYGFRPAWVRLDFGFFGDLNGGTCSIPEPDPTCPPEQARGWLVGALAGHAAKARFGRLYFELNDTHAHEWGAEGAGQDYNDFHRIRRALNLRISEDWAFHHATVLTERHGTRVDHLTMRLARARHLAGTALAARTGAA